MQQLFKLVIEPVIEAKADNHSFGFRPGRNAHQALAVVSANLKSHTGSESNYILDAGISKYFERISHTWILENFPFPKKYNKILSE